MSIVSFKKDKLRRYFFLSLFKVLREIQPDLVMSDNWGAIDAIWVGRLAGISNIIHHEHGFNVEESISTQWLEKTPLSSHSVSVNVEGCRCIARTGDHATEPIPDSMGKR